MLTKLFNRNKNQDRLLLTTNITSNYNMQVDDIPDLGSNSGNFYIKSSFDGKYILYGPPTAVSNAGGPTPQFSYNQVYRSNDFGKTFNTSILSNIRDIKGQNNLITNSGILYYATVPTNSTSISVFSYDVSTNVSTQINTLTANYGSQGSPCVRSNASGSFILVLSPPDNGGIGGATSVSYWVSTNYGVTFTKYDITGLLNGQYFPYTAIIGNNGQDLFMEWFGQAFSAVNITRYSSNYGATVSIPTGLPTGSISRYFLPSASGANIMLNNTFNYYSNDYGKTWTNTSVWSGQGINLSAEDSVKTYNNWPVFLLAKTISGNTTHKRICRYELPGNNIGIGFSPISKDIPCDQGSLSGKTQFKAWTFNVVPNTNYIYLMNLEMYKPGAATNWTGWVTLKRKYLGFIDY